MRDLWNSTDGFGCAKVMEATPYDGFSELVAYQDKMWTIKGSVWVSEDGRKWTRFAPKPHWSARHEPTVYLFQDALWVVAGNSWPLMNDVWKLAPAGESHAAVSRDDEETRFTKATAQGQAFDDRELLGRILGNVR